MKICSKCKQTKDFSLFSKDKGRKDGFQPSCKDCHKKYLAENKLKIQISRRNHYFANKEILLEKSKQHRDSNKEKLKIRSLNYYSKNREKILSKTKSYRESNKDVIAEQQKLYYAENKEKLLAYNSEYRELNNDEIRKQREQYRVTNRSRCAASDARKRAKRLRATPSWLTDEDFDNIQEFYEISRMFKIYTGQEYHVDHIVPLQGKTVCGLHVPWNLQILPAKENLSKHNKFQEQ